MPTIRKEKSVLLADLVRFVNEKERDLPLEFTGFSVDPAAPADQANILSYEENSDKSGMGPLDLKIVERDYTSSEKNAWAVKGYDFQFPGDLYIDGAPCRVAAFRVDAAVVDDQKDPLPATASVIDGLVKTALAEWNWFGRQEYALDGHATQHGKQEATDDASARVATYWSVGLHINDRTGKDTGYAWSAAFICYLMRCAKVRGPQFVYSGAHSAYIHAAITARPSSAPSHDTYGFWGYRLSERPPQIGDLISAWRPDPGSGFTGPVTYDDARKSDDGYPSHCDLVVGKTATEIVTIGGNVGQSVTKKHYAITPEGFLTPDTFSRGFAVLANRLDILAQNAPVIITPPPPAAGEGEFTIDTNLKTTLSPLTADKIRAFFAAQPDGRDSLKEIADAVMAASTKYTVNATYIVAHAICESGWGLSRLARTKKNLFGWSAYDNDPDHAKGFATRAECVDYVIGRINELYLTPGAPHYHDQPVLGDLRHGMNQDYAIEPDWGREIVKLANQIENAV